MKYRKIKIEFEDSPKRFFREFYAQEDLNLEELGSIITTIIGATYEHWFMFNKEKIGYMPYSFLTEAITPNDKYMGDYKYTDLGSNFKYEYDTGDGWRFNVNVSDKSYNLDKHDKAIIISGAGLGIWEDNICGLWNYLDGKTNPNTERKNKDDYRFPWNLNIKVLKEWDTFNEKIINELHSLIDESIIRYKDIDAKYKKNALDNLKFYKDNKDEIDKRYYQMLDKIVKKCKSKQSSKEEKYKS